MSKLGGRKFILAIVVLSAAVAMVFAGQPLTSEMVALMLGLVTAFTIGNVRTKVHTQPTPAPEIPDSNYTVLSEVAGLGCTLDILLQNSVAATEVLTSVKEDSSTTRAILTKASGGPK